MEEKVDKKEVGYLKDDIKEIIVETDDKNSKVVAVISDVLSPSKGYRVRVKFKDDVSIPISIKTRDPFILFDYFKLIKQIEKEYDCTLNLTNIEIVD
uniref:Uncharacterized protein n=1 Tax=Firmicutes phage HS08 TaxID=3056391 RepID=A0AA50ACD9_9VIRU|nr:MAG: hypothetical protein [Firmicutes phage HS08]